MANAKKKTEPKVKSGLSDPGQMGEQKLIETAKLYIDERYQRGTKSRASEKNIAHMVANFKWSHYAPLIVCLVPSEKKYAVIDGQHRLQAAIARGDIKAMPCYIVKGIDFTEQAKSFVAINTKRVQLNSLAAFHAAVASDDAEAVRVKELLDECKVEIPRYPTMNSQVGPRQMQSPGTLVKLLERYDREHIVFALNVIPEAYPAKGGALRASLIKAMAEFSSTTEDLDRPRLLRVLASIDPAQLEDDARIYMGIQGGTSLAAMIEVINRLYRNAGRKGAAA